MSRFLPLSSARSVLGSQRRSVPGSSSADSDEGLLDDEAGEGPTSGGGRAPSFTLFIDGISEPTSYYHIRGLFGQIGSLLNVFVQKQRRFGRDFRFGFVRYSSREVASMAINLFNGVLMGDSILSVAPAKFPRASCPDRRPVSAPSPSTPFLAGSQRSDERRFGVFSDDEVMMISGVSRSSPTKVCPASVLFPEISSPCRGVGWAVSGGVKSLPSEALFPELGAGLPGSVAIACLEAPSSFPVCDVLEEGSTVSEVAVVAERRRRGRPRKVTEPLRLSHSRVPFEEVAEGSSLILPEARGYKGALTRARRDFALVKQLGVVPVGSDEEAILGLADHLVANHPRLYGGS